MLRHRRVGALEVVVHAAHQVATHQGRGGRGGEGERHQQEDQHHRDQAHAQREQLQLPLGPLHGSSRAERRGPGAGGGGAGVPTGPAGALLGGAVIYASGGLRST